MQFSGKVVLITGASSGIGAATAKLFSKQGASISLSGRNIDNLKAVSKECNASVAPLIVAGELTNENDVKAILDKTIEHFKKLDVLVNNAGIIASGTIETTSLQQYDKIMNTNMRSIYHLTSLAVPHLIKTQGTIVNVSSVNGIRAFQNCLAYNLSKAALQQFTRCVALELASKKVRCNSVNPGVIVTNLHTRSGMNREEYEAFLKRTKETHPLGRPGTPEEVAKAILFLAGNDSTFTTGIALSVDGGKHAVCPR